VTIRREQTGRPPYAPGRAFLVGPGGGCTSISKIPLAGKMGWFTRTSGDKMSPVERTKLHVKGEGLGEMQLYVAVGCGPPTQSLPHDEGGALRGKGGVSTS